MDKDYLESDKVIDHLHLTEEEVKLFNNNKNDEDNNNEIEIENQPSRMSMPGSLLPTTKANTVTKTFNTEVGREIHKFLSKSQKKSKVETFLPNRCKYQFNLNIEDDEEMYNTIMRSKADCPNPNAYCFVEFNDNLIELIKDSIQSYGNSKLKKKKLEEAKLQNKGNQLEEEIHSVVPVIQPVAIEDDMFADI